MYASNDAVPRCEGSHTVFSTHCRDARTVRDLGAISAHPWSTEVPTRSPGTVSLPPMLEVGRLRALLAMSEHGGSSGAARALGRPAGDVAGQLSDWERELGLPLVDGDRLTPAGRRLAEHAGTLLGQLESAESDAAAVAGRVAGTLRLGSARTPAGCCCPRRWRRCGRPTCGCTYASSPTSGSARSTARSTWSSSASTARRCRTGRTPRWSGGSCSPSRCCWPCRAGTGPPAPASGWPSWPARRGSPAPATRWWRWSGPRPGPGSRPGWSPRSARTRSR